MKILVAGSHGLIGTALVAHLRGDGHSVHRLVRRPTAAPGEVSWDPDEGRLDPRALEDADAVVNLAGAGVGDRRMTPEYKEVVRSSRTRTTGLLARTIAQLGGRPPVLLNASGIGAYGERGDDVLDETSALGDTFFAGVVRDWEGATAPASDAGARVVHLRTGIVLTPRGGALERLLPIVRAGVGGRLGSGDQFWSWITLPDHIAAVVHLLRAHDVHGPVNVAAPHPATNAEVTRELARALRRPARLPVPAAALRLVLGEFSSEILGSIRALPAVLSGSGFEWQHRTVGEAAAWVAREVHPDRAG